MSFRANGSQQISLFDSINALTPKEQKALENSRDKVFAVSHHAYRLSNIKIQIPKAVCIKFSMYKYIISKGF